MAVEWRAAVPGDAQAIAGIAAAAFGPLAETPALYAERIALAPEGCFVLTDAADTVAGHCISHPWRGAPPPLHRSIAALPTHADHWYIHDVAIDARARGNDAVARLMPRLWQVAAVHGIDRLRLVAVGGAEGYWARLGFAATGDAQAGYGDVAVSMCAIRTPDLR